MADDKNPVANTGSDQPSDSGKLKGSASAPPAAPAGAAAPAPDPGAAGPGSSIVGAGTKDEIATQGFTGVKVQADQQALTGHVGEDVPMGGNPLTSPFKDPNRPDTTPQKVSGNKFWLGGAKFAKGETIYLTKDEVQRMQNHLER